MQWLSRTRAAHSHCSFHVGTLVCQELERPRQRGESRQSGYTDVLKFVLVEEWNGVDDHPREGPAKVDNLVHDEAHDARGDRVILHPEIPGLWVQVRTVVFVKLGAKGLGGGTYGPQALEDVEVDIVLGDLLENGGDGGSRGQTRNGRVPACARVS